MADTDHTDLLLIKYVHCIFANTHRHTFTAESGSKFDTYPMPQIAKIDDVRHLPLDLIGQMQVRYLRHHLDSVLAYQQVNKMVAIAKWW